MSLEQKLRPRGLAEWTAVLAAAGLGVSVVLHVFDATVLFTYHPSAMALSFGALMPLRCVRRPEDARAGREPSPTARDVDARGAARSRPRSRSGDSWPFI